MRVKLSRTPGGPPGYKGPFSGLPFSSVGERLQPPRPSLRADPFTHQRREGKQKERKSNPLTVTQ